MALSTLGAETAVYVGDTDKDRDDAMGAGCEFVGVSYGFEDLGLVRVRRFEDLGEGAAGHVSQLAAMLAERMQK